MKFNYLYLFIIFYFFYSCENSNAKTLITGNIPNLPDGTLYLYKDDPDNKIATTKTVDGKFSISHKWEEKNECFYIGIDHIDTKGISRIFSFPTNANFRGQKWGSSVFLSDSTIIINGNIKYDEFVGFKLPPDKKFVTGPPLIVGKQTEAFYNIDGDLFENISSKTVSVIREKLEQYPTSYHLLYKINENRNSFSASQVQKFLKTFKGDITKSKTYKTLTVYNDKRLINTNYSLPLLEDSETIKKEIIDKKHKKHLIIFWASWCGPCRQEIPLLKKMHSDYSKEIEFVSISIDDNKRSWQKALKIENMAWQQLIVDKNNKSDFESLQIQFKLNQAIPYTILVNENMKILASFTGLSDEKELKKILEK